MNNQNAKRGRHRNNNNNQGRRGSPGRQNFDSNGPGVRIRGNASQIHDKYVQLARDAQSSGDRILAESMLQFAEHYYRILNADQAERANRQSGQAGQSSQAGQAGQDRYRGRRPETESQDSESDSSEEAVVESTAPSRDTSGDGQSAEAEAARDDERRGDSRRGSGQDRRGYSRRDQENADDTEGRDALARHLGADTAVPAAPEDRAAQEDEAPRKPRRGRPPKRAAADGDGEETRPRKSPGSRAKNGGRPRRFESASDSDPELPLDIAPASSTDAAESAGAE